jgi:hypothetical protein
MMTAVGLFVCPSDVAPPVPGFGRSSYRYNVGPNPWHAAVDALPESCSGPFTVHRFYRSADFLDGLSNTVGVSERVQGDWTKQIQGPGDYLLTQIGDRGKRIGPDWVLAACAAATDAPSESRGGESWFLSGYHFTNYNHCAAPNARVQDCALDDRREDLHARTMHEGVFTARSYHPGGVNTLSMDGSVRSVSDSINVQVWRSLATRSNGEAVSVDTF